MAMMSAAPAMMNRLVDQQLTLACIYLKHLLSFISLCPKLCMDFPHMLLVWIGSMYNFVWSCTGMINLIDTPTRKNCRKWIRITNKNSWIMKVLCNGAHGKSPFVKWMLVEWTYRERIFGRKSFWFNWNWN